MGEGGRDWVREMKQKKEERLKARGGLDLPLLVLNMWKEGYEPRNADGPRSWETFSLNS